MERLLEECSELRGRSVLVQIANPAHSHGRDVEEVADEARSITRRINAHFGRPGYDSIVLIDRPVSTFEKAAYYATAECVVVSAVRDGLNRTPYIYTVCRELLASTRRSPRPPASSPTLSRCISRTASGSLIPNDEDDTAWIDTEFKARAEQKEATENTLAAYKADQDMVLTELMPTRHARQLFDEMPRMLL
uniref:Uncharacterized protein n=1 Tax=Ananas comosus var. bracteatus TaxID=296719 RepID=A0A6V7P9F3_ANACO|nr:unnamed protein product [Ananas comosus var. bracteatus]